MRPKVYYVRRALVQFTDPFNTDLKRVLTAAQALCGQDKGDPSALTVSDVSQAKSQLSKKVGKHPSRDALAAYFDKNFPAPPANGEAPPLPAPAAARETVLAYRADFDSMKLCAEFVKKVGGVDNALKLIDDLETLKEILG